MRRFFTVVLILFIVCAGSVLAVDGIAISTHRIGGSDAGPGVHPSMFGDIVRHYIRDGKVVASKVIYKGKARGAVINQRGDRVAFLKLDGRICLANIDGSGLKELANSKNRNASAMDWPAGDWIYYSEDGKWPTGDWFTGESKASETSTVRRINAVTGEDEVVGRTHSNIWQISLGANTGKGRGKFTITGYLLDFSNPSEKLNNHVLGCGTAVSPGGNYITEVAPTHADLRIYDWSLNNLISFHVNEFQPGKNDGRVSLYRPHWSVNSEYWIVITQGADFGCTKKTNMVLYDWKNRKQIQVTDNPLEGEASDEGEDFWLKGVAHDLADVTIEGEAPFTVELGQGRIEGTWEWDFADGTKASSDIGKHTYQKAGAYTITAKQKDTRLSQAINVLPKRAPEVVSADLLDGRRVLIEFSEPIQLASSEEFIVTPPDVKVESVDHKEGSSRILVCLSNPIRRDITILLKPIRDCAQVPNAMAKPALVIRTGDWPSNREALALLWKTNLDRNLVYNPILNAETRIGVYVWDGISTFDRNGAMLCQSMFHVAPLDNSHYPFSSVQEQLSKVCDNAFTVEAHIATAALRQSSPDQPPVFIMANAQDRNNGAFWLGQNESNLILKFASDNGMQGPVVLHRFTDTQPHHFVISYEPGKLAVYVDGTQTFTAANLTGKPRFNADQYLTLGSAGRDTSRTWRGRLESIAVYGRALPAAEAKANHAACKDMLGKRRQVTRIAVRATLTAATRIKTVADIAPYDSAFLISEYTVVRVLKGECDSKKIRVAQWGVIRKKIQAVNRERIGTTRNLVLELLSDNPQFEEIFRKDTLPANLDLPLYVQVGEAPAAGTSKAPAVMQETVGPVRLQYEMPFDGFVTLVIEHETGRRVKNIVGMAPRAKGPQTDYWDCTNEEGQVVSAGNYRWRGLLHKGINPVYEASYGGPGTGQSPNADPDDKTRVFAGGQEFKLDYAANKATPVATLGDTSGQLMKIKGREYIMNKHGKLLLRKGDTLVPVAAMAAFFIKDFGAYKDFPLPPPPDGTHNYASLSFLWMDRNDDNQAQADELTLGSFWTGWKEWKYPVSSGNSYWLDESFNLYGYAAETWYGSNGRGPFITKIPLKGWTPGGAPLWDTNGQQLIREGTMPGGWQMYLPTEGKVIFGNPITCMGDDGVPQWTYSNNWPWGHNWNIPLIPGREDVLVGTGGCVGRAATPVGTVFAMSSIIGRLYLTTTDGLFLASVFQDWRLGGERVPKDPQPGSPFGALTMGPMWASAHFFKAEKSNQFYVIAGSDKYNVIRLDGFDTLRAIPGGELAVSEQDAAAAEALVEQRTEMEAANDLLTIARMKTVAVDGKLDKYPYDSFVEWVAGPYEARAAMAFDAANLYLACQVFGDSSPMINGGDDVNHLFLTGDSLNLYLGTDPAANALRKEPAVGDLRLLVSVFQGNPIAVLYRWKVEGDRNPVTFAGGRTVDRVDVLKEAKIIIERRDGGYSVEIAVPLASIGFAPQHSQAYRTDLGVVVSNSKGDGRIMRFNWADKTGLPPDESGEIAAAPNRWSAAIVEP